MTVTDNDTAGLTVSATDLAVTEGASASFTVRLATKPSGDVTVGVAQTGTANSDVTLDKSSLTFTASNWDRTQTVTVSAAEDDDASNDSATLQVTASGADYGSVPAKDVAVTVTDNDTLALTVVDSPVNITESGAAGSFTVRLSHRPAADVTVSLSKTNDDVTLSGATLTGSSLTFTTANWDTPQTVTVTAGEDLDATDETDTITLSATGVANQTVAVNIDDNDTAGLTLSSARVSVTEGSSATFTVRLASQPSGTVTVSLPRAVQGVFGDAATFSPTALTFTASDWSDTQTVTVTAVEDDDAINTNGRIPLSAAGGGYDGVIQYLSIAVVETDAPDLTLSASGVSMNEGGSGTFTVKLASRPSGTVTVRLSQVGATNADVTFDTDAGSDGNQDTLSFTSTTWDQVQTVTVRAADDADALADSATIHLDASGGDYVSVLNRVTVSVTDTDTPALTLSTASVGVDEGGDANFTVKLATLPSGTVTVTLAQSGTANADVTFDTDAAEDDDQNTLTFTTSNWDDAQTVTVSAKGDDDATDDSATISLTASGGGYAGVAGGVDVTVTDDDEEALTIVAADPFVVAEGDSSTFTVKLATLPSGTVTVSLSQVAPANTDVTFDTDAGTANDQDTLSFTTGNWNKTQTVTVSAAADNDTADDSGDPQAGRLGRRLRLGHRGHLGDGQRHQHAGPDHRGGGSL